MKMSTTLMMLCITTSCLASPVAVPKVDAYIVDETKTLTQSQLNELRAVADSIDKETGTVAATLIVKTAGEEGINDYAQRAAETIHPGHAGSERGVVLVVAKDDKQWAIRTTRNTGITLTDANSKDILNKMKKRMSETKGDMFSVLMLYHQEIKPLVQKPAIEAIPVAPKKPDDSDYWIWVLGGILSLFAIGGGCAYYKHNKRKREFEEYMKKVEEERIRREQQMIRERNLKAQIAEREKQASNLTPAVVAASAVAAAPYIKPSEKFSLTNKEVKPRTKPKTEVKKTESTYVPVPVPIPVSSDDSWSRSSSSSSWSSSDSNSSWSSDSSSSSSSYDGGGSSGSWD